MEQENTLLIKELYHLTRKNIDKNFTSICEFLEKNLAGDYKKFRNLNFQFYLKYGFGFYNTIIKVVASDIDKIKKINQFIYPKS